ncbi:MAG: CBS domain-containing protein, partial [Opitutae bacterium]|nr:CBS domain-containing protein [Opitutae bacterium]
PLAVRDLAPEALENFLATNSHDRFPVVADERLRGVLHRREALAALAARRPPALETAVACSPAASLRTVADLIVGSPSGLLVLQNEVGPEGRVIGVVTLHDILRAQKMFARDLRD